MSQAAKTDPEKIIVRDLYTSEKIYPRQAKGIFARFRVLSVFLLLGLYYGMPWLTWNGRQAVLFDLPARQFHMFGVTFWPQDFIYLTLLLMICAMGLFLFTSVAGRLWCGYTCPQTVWTETFLWIEQLIEGDRNQRMKLDKQALSTKKLIKKSIKHSIWLIFAGFTGYTFVGYFSPIEPLWQGLTSFTLSGWEWFWIGLYSIATYLNAGMLREQVCLHMCPYARFQSAMFDPDTLIISYDKKRGENRGHRKKNSDYKEQGLGDCIDCYQCVQVCPTGIDIRDGLQYECIACAACIDICDTVMEKMDYPKGLIQYTTENTEQGNKSAILRPRLLAYSGVFIILVSVFFTLLATRTTVEISVIRDRATLFKETFNGDIENIYRLRILNMSQQKQQYQLSVSGINGLQLQGQTQLEIEAGEILTLPVRLSAKSESLNTRASEVNFHLTTQGNTLKEVSATSKFLGPER